jgi:hypothetical protein
MCFDHLSVHEMNYQVLEIKRKTISIYTIHSFDVENKELVEIGK